LKQHKLDACRIFSYARRHSTFRLFRNFFCCRRGCRQNKIRNSSPEIANNTGFLTENEFSNSPEETEIEINAALATEADLMWSNIFWEEIKTTIARIEEGAKQIITIATFSQTIYFAAISFSTVKQGLHLLPPFQQWLFGFLLVLPLLCWCMSLLGATFVLLPRRYPKFKAHPDYPDEVERRFWIIVDYKFHWLKIAQIILLVGFFVLLISVFVYFAFIPLPQTPTTNSP
jgi:hypothetical protein